MGADYVIRHESGRYLAVDAGWVECASDALRLSAADARTWCHLSCEPPATEAVAVDSLLATAGC